MEMKKVEVKIEMIRIKNSTLRDISLEAFTFNAYKQSKLETKKLLQILYVLEADWDWFRKLLLPLKYSQYLAEGQ